MDSHLPVNNLTIIGLGLMGGSLSMAVKNKRIARTITGFSRSAATRNKAIEQGVVDKICDTPECAVSKADMVVLCTPVGAISELVKRCISNFAVNSVVTDIGSTKAEIVSEVDPMFHDSPSMYVGSHPITGSEREGLEAACPDLYENSIVIVTPTEHTNQLALKQVQTFWQGLNAVVLTASPEEHDLMAARASHLPHLVAAMLSSSVGRDRIDQVRNFCGPGFFDATRIADSAPDLWHDIIKSNRKAVVHELKDFEEQVRQVTDMVRTGDFTGLRQFLDNSRNRRRKLQNKRELKTK